MFIYDDILSIFDDENRSSRIISPSGSIRFATGERSTPLPLGEVSSDNVTEYEEGENLPTQGDFM